MATSNPAFSRDLFPGYEQVYGVPQSTTMTVQGTVAKTLRAARRPAGDGGVGVERHRRADDRLRAARRRRASAASSWR